MRAFAIRRSMLVWMAGAAACGGRMAEDARDAATVEDSTSAVSDARVGPIDDADRPLPDTGPPTCARELPAGFRCGIPSIWPAPTTICDEATIEAFVAACYGPTPTKDCGASIAKGHADCYGCRWHGRSSPATACSPSIPVRSAARRCSARASASASASGPRAIGHSSVVVHQVRSSQ